MQKQDLIYRKQYMQQLHSLKDQNIIKVISGVRRCGKSTLLMMFADELIRNGIQENQIQFYNFEDLDTLAIGDIYQIHAHIKNLLVENRPNYIFLDEVQNIKEFQRLVDSLYIKSNVDIYITGSNAYMLSGELATLLTGRYVEINLLPLQFTEYNDFIHTKSPNLSNIETLANFLHYGSVPEYVKQLQIGEKQADLFADSILKTIVEKDIFQRLNITNRHDFNKILDFIFDSVGSYVSPRSISDTLRSNGTVIDKQTVAKYLDAMCDAYLIYKVPRYEIQGKGLLQTLNKYYVVDPCFAKVRLKKKMLKDRSHWLENMVYLELVRRNKDVFIGKRNNLEVDFVVVDSDGYTAYYQVAWTTENPETLERELASLRAIRDSNPKYLLTTDNDFNPVYDGIRKLNVIEWMLRP
ncbi:MAG: ATP-binding protein [Alphaproteobacteria bacterium]|nr:ATP-binding protein [Alphaproteobacteria bacterium]